MEMFLFKWEYYRIKVSALSKGNLIKYEENQWFLECISKRTNLLFMHNVPCYQFIYMSFQKMTTDVADFTCILLIF